MKRQGELKRVLSIVWLLQVTCLVSYGQIGRISGELRYVHHYQDFLYDNTLTKILIMNPVLDLRMTGNIISPRLLSYSLFSSLNANFVSTGNPYFNYSSSQYSWNRYNLSLNVLPYSPVKVSLGARENSSDIRSETDLLGDRTSNRNQEQRLDLSVNQISWLPSISLAFVRNRSFSDLADEGFPYDVVNQTLTFSASGSTDTTGSYGLSATVADFFDRLNNAYDKFLTLQFTAERALSDKHLVSISTEYEQYTGYSGLGGAIVYSGIMTNKLRISTSLSTSVTQSLYFQARTLSLSQSGSYRINENFLSSLGVSGFMSTGQALGRRDKYSSLGTFGGLQHRRSFAGMTILNSLSIGQNQQQYANRYTNFQAALSNTLMRQVGVFTMNVNYDISYLRVRNAASYDVVDNNAGLSLSGVLPRGIQSQSSIRYRDNRYPGDPSAYRNQRLLFIMQRFNGSFVYIIPFTLGLSASANWYFSMIHGQTYGWTLSFASPSFFLRGLSADYVYSRSYDPYFDREVGEHRGSLSYQWRSVVFTSRFRYATFPVRVREVVFSVSRYF